MKPRDKIILVARREIGTIERPVNKVKYNEWYGNGLQNGGSWAPWCCTFVSWVFYFAGHALPKIDHIEGYMNIITALRWAEKNNHVIDLKDIKQGDIVALDFTGNGLPDHTGIFEKWEGKNLVLIEGNTTTKRKGSQANGGEVARKIRKTKYVKGVISANIAYNINS